jgi:hypothetical protein
VTFARNKGARAGGLGLFTGGLGARGAGGLFALSFAAIGGGAGLGGGASAAGFARATAASTAGGSIASAGAGGGAFDT